MDETQSNNKPVKKYHWRNKTEGKEQYVRFKKEFVANLKEYRYLLEPGGVELRLGPEPELGPAPLQPSLRKEWREDKANYDKKKEKIDGHFAKALSDLELSFDEYSTPRHIIDRVLETPPEGVQPSAWTYRQKFEACWEALREEFQPSNATDVSALREQIFKLTDEGPGGFDTFRAEFHRLMTEILATGTPDSITTRELNSIVRDGIKNQTIWQMVCHRIYDDDQYAPWERTFDAVSRALTSYRLKGIDPYNQAKSAPSIGTAPVSANTVSLPNVDQSVNGKRPHHSKDGRQNKRQKHGHRDAKGGGRANNREEQRPNAVSQKCTRCWMSSNHNFKNCTSQKCACGAPLNKDQSLCFEYDNHPTRMKFQNKVPKAVADMLEAFRRGKSTNSGSSTSKTYGESSSRGGTKYNKIGALAAQVAEELVRRGITGEGLDSYD